jgi:hypothetical protein
MFAPTSTPERQVTEMPQEPGRTVYRVVPDPVLVVDASPIPLVIYKPSQLFVDGEPAKGFRSKTTGTPGTATWAGLVRLLSRAPEGDPTKYPDPNVQKSARGGWSACGLADGRRVGLAFVEARLLGLDIDKHGDIEKALKAFGPFRKIVHSTYRSSTCAPRCRVLLMLKDACRDAEVFRRAHRVVRQAVVQAGWFEADDFDDAGCDPSRLWFLPMVPPGTPYVCHVTDGELLDLSKLVTPARPIASRKAITEMTPNSSRALAWAGRKMAEAPEGHRHTTVYSMAAWLAEIAPPIPDTDILSALLPHAPQGREAEFERTVGDAIRQGRAGR